jgi:hypothetical protein
LLTFFLFLRTNAQQVVDFVKAAQGTEASVDGTDAIGGTTGKIALDAASYVSFFVPVGSLEV